MGILTTVPPPTAPILKQCANFSAAGVAADTSYTVTFTPAVAGKNKVIQFHFGAFRSAGANNMTLSVLNAADTVLKASAAATFVELDGYIVFSCNGGMAQVDVYTCELGTWARTGGKAIDLTTDTTFKLKLAVGAADTCSVWYDVYESV
jgi:hypothetical protein